jgi:hypothetical protein
MRTIELTDARIKRFWSYVDKRGPNECWPWLRDFHSTGHGVYREWSGNKTVVKFYAHRLSALIAGQTIDGAVVRHDCDNPPCVNPLHLRTGTQADNIQDAIERRRLDTSGLAIGQARQWPPRPCLRCGITVTEGRKRYCPPCRILATRDIERRKHARMKLRGAA